jgi:hypothetical protein
MNTANFEPKQVIEVTDIHENTSQEVIRITVDRLRLVLVEHKDGFERKKEWHTPLGMFVTLILVFITSSFKSALGFTADTWAAVFLILLAVSAAWLIRSAIVAYRSPSMDEIVSKMKKRG